jgi:isoleucyl-tRNA synthetase
MPYAQWHYPLKTKIKLKNKDFPADFIEGVDQTRGWFYTLHAIGTLVLTAYKKCSFKRTGFRQNGQKRLGNAADP